METQEAATMTSNVLDVTAFSSVGVYRRFGEPRYAILANVIFSRTFHAGFRIVFTGTLTA
jgi:uncharacterized PurR-regulated membrane protein YhhQ (DUF165 family)